MRLPLIGVAVAVTCLTMGCDQKRSEAIDLSVREDVPAAAATSAGDTDLRIAVSAMISPAATFDAYEAIIETIGERLSRKVHLVQRKTYAEVNALLLSGEVDVAFVCTGAFVAGEKTFGLKAVAVPVVKGKSTYRSYIIVRTEDPYRSFGDLRGKKFAFTDPLSNTGRLYPLQLLLQANTTPEKFFAQTFFTGSHDRSIHAVMDGMVDGAAVDSLIFDGHAAVGDTGERVKILKTSPDFGMPPVVVSPELDEATVARIGECLLSLGRDEKSARILARLGVDGFVPPVSEWYGSVRRMRSDLEKAGLLKQ